MIACGGRDGVPPHIVMGLSYSALNVLFVSKAMVRLQSTSDILLADPTKVASLHSISPALLERARAVAWEHKDLSEQLSEAFNTNVAKKIGELSVTVEALNKWDVANKVRQSRLLHTILTAL